MSNASGPRFFFVHVMKTAGTTFHVQVLKANFGPEERYPSPNHDFYSYDLRESSYWRVSSLAELSPERKLRIRAYAGHFPFVATEIIGDPDLVLLTILRDPVERTLSYLRHCKRYHPVHQDLSFEEIYEDSTFFGPFILNHQTKIFAMTNEDRPEYCYDVIDVDDRRLDIAKSNLERVDIVGFQDRFEDFLLELEARFGWTIPTTTRLREGAEEPVSKALRQRIASDNAIDMEFYEFAKRGQSK